MARILLVVVLCLVAVAVNAECGEGGCYGGDMSSCNCNCGPKIKVQRSSSKEMMMPMLPKDPKDHPINDYVVNHGLVAGAICDYCQILMAYLQEQGYTPEKGVDWIVDKLKERCNQFSGWKVTACNLFVSGSGFVIAQIIESKVPMDEVCHKLGVC